MTASLFSVFGYEVTFNFALATLFVVSNYLSLFKLNSIMNFAIKFSLRNYVEKKPGTAFMVIAWASIAASFALLIAFPLETIVYFGHFAILQKQFANRFASVRAHQLKLATRFLMIKHPVRF